MKPKTLALVLLSLAAAGTGIILLRPPLAEPAASAAAPPGLPAKSAPKSPVPPLSAPPEPSATGAEAASAPIPVPGPELQATLDRLQSEIDLVLREGDYAAAHGIVDEAAASAGFKGPDQQRILVTKLGLYGRQGDHAAMVELMDRIIAEAPDSPLAAAMARQRPAIELASKRPANDPGPCATCGRIHPDGAHPAAR